MFPMVIHGRSPKRWKCHSIFSSLPDSLSLRKTFSIGVGWGERGGTGFGIRAGGVCLLLPRAYSRISSLRYQATWWSPSLPSGGARLGHAYGQSETC